MAMTEQPRPAQRWAVFALIPSAAWLTLFFLVPLGIVAAISVMQAGEPVTWRFDGSSFARLIDPLHLNIVARSVGLAVAATVLCFLLGYPLAYYIVHRPPATRRWLYFLVLLPLWANSLILIYAWMVLLRPNGVVEQILAALGLVGEEPLSFLYTPGAVLLGLVYWYLPFMVYPLYASIEKFDFHLLDAAYDLGASRWQAFRQVLLPATMPGVVAGSLLVFIESLGAFVVPELLGGSKSMMIGNLVQQRFLSTPQDWPLGAAAALALLAVIGGAMVLYLRYGQGDPDAH
jgi:spermidine/putrescine transport system permease protein